MAERVKLTKRVVEGATTGGAKRAILWDTALSGFGLRVTQSARTYFVQYKAGSGRAGKTTAYTIGRHGPWTVEQARKEARRILGDVAKGANPQAEKQAARQPQPSRRFDDVAADFLDKHVARNLKAATAKDYRHITKTVLVPAWTGRDVREIERADVVALVDGKAETSPAMARLVFAVASSLFGFAVDRALLDANPCDSVRRPPAPKPRDRVLSDYEVGLLWRASREIGWPFGPAIRFLVVTGQRREEVSGAQWGEMDTRAAVWTLPSARTKNGAPHEVDLSPLALEILDEQPEMGRYVFGATGEKPLQGWSQAKRKLDARMAALAEADGADTPPPWRVHDIRRTVATGLAGLGVQPVVVEKVLNHSSGRGGGLVSVYQRYDYRQERRAALDAWERHLRSVIGRANGDNVVAFPSGA